MEQYYCEACGAVFSSDPKQPVCRECGNCEPFALVQAENFAELLRVVESMVMWPDIRKHIAAKFPGLIKQANGVLVKVGSNMALPIDTEGGA